MIFYQSSRPRRDAPEYISGRLENELVQPRRNELPFECFPLL
jgi:hypothetical protein